MPNQNPDLDGADPNQVKSNLLVTVETMRLKIAEAVRDAFNAADAVNAEALANRNQQIAERDAENARLTADCAAMRKALIETGRTLGCLLDDDVSSAFITSSSCGVPAEAEALLAKHAKELEEARHSQEVTEICAKANRQRAEAAEAALAELREAISPHRIAKPEYYIGVAKRMRGNELVIKPLTAANPDACQQEISALLVSQAADLGRIETRYNGLFRELEEKTRKAEERAEMMRRQMLALAEDKGSLMSALACERANYAEEIKLRQTCESLLAAARRDTRRLDCAITAVSQGNQLLYEGDFGGWRWSQDSSNIRYFGAREALDAKIDRES